MSEKINQTLALNRTWFLLALLLTRGLFLMELLFEGQLSSSAVSLPAPEELCRWAGARGKHRLFQYSTTAQASGTQEVLLQSLLRFQRQEGFFLALSAPEVREGRGCEERGSGSFCTARVGGCCYLVSLLRCIRVQLSLPSWKWIHKSQQARQALDVLCFWVVKTLLEEAGSSGSNPPADGLLS